jgi:hypothetical protein
MTAIPPALDLVRDALQAGLLSRPAWAGARVLKRHAPAERARLFDDIDRLLDRHPLLLPALTGPTALDLLFAQDRPDERILQDLLYPWLEGVAGRRLEDLGAIVHLWPAALPLEDAALRDLARRGRLSGEQLCPLARTARAPASALARALVHLDEERRAGRLGPQELEVALPLALLADGPAPYRRAAAFFDLWCAPAGRDALADAVRQLLAPGEPPAARDIALPAAEPADPGTLTVRATSAALLWPWRPWPPPATSAWRRCLAFVRDVCCAVRWGALTDALTGRWYLSDACRAWLAAVCREPLLAPLWAHFRPPLLSRLPRSSAAFDPAEQREAALLILLERPPPAEGRWLVRLFRAVESAWPVAGVLPARVSIGLARHVERCSESDELTVLCLEGLLPDRVGRRLGLRQRLAALYERSSPTDPALRRHLLRALAACER